MAGWLDGWMAGWSQLHVVVAIRSRRTISVRFALTFSRWLTGCKAGWLAGRSRTLQ